MTATFAHVQPRGWELFGHGADVGIRGWGRTVEAAFEEGARALTAVVTDPASVRPAQAVFVETSAPDLEVLFADWINAIVTEMATRRMLFSRFEVAIDERHLRGRAWGEPVDRARHSPAVEVKGATLTALSVRRKPDDGAWRAQCIVDV